MFNHAQRKFVVGIYPRQPDIYEFNFGRFVFDYSKYSKPKLYFFCKLTYYCIIRWFTNKYYS